MNWKWNGFVSEIFLHFQLVWMLCSGSAFLWQNIFKSVNDFFFQISIPDAEKISYQMVRSHAIICIQEKIATFSPWKEFWIICFSWIRFEPKAPCQGKLANFEMFMRTPKARENIFAAVMKKILYIYTIILGKFAKNWLKF